MRALLILILAAAPLSAQTLAIVNGTVITVTKGTFKGSVLVRDGKIAEVGEKVLIPDGVKVLDAAGRYVMPGIIDPHSHIGVDGGVNESSLSVSSMVDAKDAINPEDISIYRALAGGVTTIHTLHGSADSIGGQTVTLKLRWGKDAAGLLMAGAMPGLKMALGENVKRAGNPTGRTATGGTPYARYPATRMGVEDVIRQAFTEARAYQAEWAAYRAAVARGERPVPPRKDLKLEPLVEVLEGKRFVHAHSYRADETLMLMKVADEFGFKIKAFVHVLEGYKIAREMAAHGAGATTFSDWWAYKMEAIDAIPFNAALLHKMGVLTSLNSEDAELMRHMNTEAAKTMKYGGLTEDEALAMITINPAKQMGIESRVGSLEAGKDADIVIFDKHPLSTYAKVQTVLIDGVEYFDRDKELTRQSERDAEKRKLIEKDKERQKQRPAEQEDAPRRQGA
jgi:imidazolonepropionase-like amidohydrolase